MFKYARGFSLIELIIYIVVMGFLAVAILLGMNLSLERSPQISHITQATLFAQQRMEVIAGYKMANGFSAFVDPCEGTPVFPGILCNAGGYDFGFDVSSTITPSWDGDSNLTLVEVVVTDSENGTATFTTVMSNYE